MQLRGAGIIGLVVAEGEAGMGGRHSEGIKRGTNLGTLAGGIRKRKYFLSFLFPEEQTLKPNICWACSMHLDIGQNYYSCFPGEKTKAQGVYI